jgi:DNA-binding NarL/FixJ family response regulator/PAS domain-containing protein
VIDAVIDAAPDGVIAVDPGGRVEYLNRAAERLLETSHSAAEGRRLSELTEVALDALQISDRPIDTVVRRRDGSDLAVRLTVTRPDEGAASRWVWIRAASYSEEESARLRKVFESAEVVGQIGSWELRPRTGELLWSDNMYRIYGYEPGEIPPSPERVFELVHPDDLAGVMRVVERLGAVAELAPLEYRIMLPSRGLRYLRVVLAIAEERDGRPWRLVGTVQDVTDQRRAEREIAAHVAVSRALSEWTSLDQGAPRLLGGIAEAIEFSVGVLWVPMGEVLVARAFWRAGTVNAAAFEAATRDRLMPMGLALPGEVWQTRQPVSLSIALEGSPYLRRDAAVQAGMRGATAFPALRAEEVLAVLEFLTPDERGLPERLTRSLTGVGHEIGHFLAARRGELEPPRLTPREIDVVRLAAQGGSVREIAQMLVVSPSTVKTHLENIYAKLDVTDRAAAVASALRGGVID